MVWPWVNPRKLAPASAPDLQTSADASHDVFGRWGSGFPSNSDSHCPIPSSQAGLSSI